MSPRVFPALVAALVLTLTGCGAATSGDQADLQAGATTKPAGLRPGARVPFDAPYYGTRKDGEPWRTSGHTPKPALPLPFTHGILSEGQLDRATKPNGVVDYVRDGVHYYHPVAIAQYALAQLGKAGDATSAPAAEDALHRAEVNAKALLAGGKVHHGALYFPYPFDFSTKGVLHAPWWSAMAQGEALSLFVRLYRVTDEQRWHEAAVKTFASLSGPENRGPRTNPARPWTTEILKHHYLWFEEYAGDTTPLVVLNGDMFALFGIYDYQRLTHSKTASRLFDAGVTALRELLPQLQHPGGGVSYYCLQKPYCFQPKWQNEKYHGIVYRQMKFIADMTDDPWFRREANRYNQDHDSWPLKPEWYE